MPVTLIDGIPNQAYPTRRFGSAWMGLITHTAPSFLVVGALILIVIQLAAERPDPSPPRRSHD